MSVGVATLPDVAMSADGLIQAADEAMYWVKDRGKNGIHVAVESQSADSDRGMRSLKAPRHTHALFASSDCKECSLSLRSLFSLFSSDLAIDLGTANTCVYARGKGIVVNEPSIVAINKVNGRIEAVGKDAKDMLGRTPGNIVAIKPMKDGVIADFEVTEKMLTYFIKKAHNRNVWVRPRIVIGVPSEITQVEKRAVKDSAYRAKASEVHLVEEAMAAAIGAGHADHRAVGQHDRRHRRRHDRHRRHLARRHRLQQGGPRRRQRDGRGDHPVHQEDVQPAHRRAHGRSRSRWRSAPPSRSRSG